MRISGLSRALSVPAFIVAMLAAQGAKASPIEHAVDVSGVSAGFTNLAYGDHTINASLGNALEVDSYTFSANAGDQIRLLLHTQTAGIDATAVLRDSHGTVLGSGACAGTWYDQWYVGRIQTCSAVFGQTIASTGTYTINFSDGGANNAGNYELHLEQYPPKNNWVGFSYGAPPTDAIDHATDMDFWAFQGAAGTGARLSISSNSGGLDPYAEIWDPSGTSFKTLSCSGTGCTASFDFDFTMSGIYRIAINDVGFDEVGNYTLGMNCLYGACAIGAPAPVPEPETYAMLLAGLGIIGSMARRRRPIG